MKDGNSLQKHKLMIRITQEELLRLKVMAAHRKTSVQRLFEEALEDYLKNK